MKFEDRVRIFEHKLNDTEDQIIEFIKENKKLVIDTSIQKLSEMVFTVPNTIVRLCKKLGYDGFSEFKIALKLEEETVINIVSTIPENITKTYEIMDSKAINKVAKRINEARNIFFYGVGDSLPFCEMMTKYLRCVGRKAEFFTHHHDMLFTIENTTPKDLVFVISASGETVQVLEAVKMIKEKGATIISLTHLCDNSIAKLSDISLYCFSPKQKLNNYDITDRIPMMIVLRRVIEKIWLLQS
ncbi:MurR/RpiR family transcriptional regulator [Clostridium frigoris]|uniref:MurR/RpiR family transcriptional regulator n=1 Tax=Clostridium frigoris TaxID=205327 RepID=A0ABS6BYI8_9CLOT|nr:MurR/RpiR family transcriptional regulator [Clostridium frigoris]MBU3161679.1 MurR/RpiR family transcriptional regulator [Clostridium frigoris]